MPTVSSEELNLLVSYFSHLDSQQQGFWSLYIVIYLGLFGYVIQAREKIRPKDYLFLLAVFLVFAISNLYVINHLHDSLSTIRCAVKRDFPNTVLSSSMKLSNPLLVLSCHLFFDLSMCGWLIWKWVYSKFPTKKIENLSLDQK